MRVNLGRILGRLKNFQARKRQCLKHLLRGSRPLSLVARFFFEYLSGLRSHQVHVAINSVVMRFYNRGRIFECARHAVAEVLLKSRSNERRGANEKDNRWDERKGNE